MKTLFIVCMILITSSLLAKETTTVLETSLQETDLSSNAIFVLDKDFDAQDIFLSYKKDLVIISLKNSIMINKKHIHKATDKRIIRTLVHSPNLNRVDYRIRFKSEKLIKPELNEIQFKDNKIIVKFFKSSKDMLLSHLQSKNSEKKEKAEEMHGHTSQKTVQAQKVELKKAELQSKKNIAKVKKDTSASLSSKDKKVNNKLNKLNKPNKNNESKALIASPAPPSFNGTVLMILLFLGAIAIYLKKKNPNLVTTNEGFKILSTKSLGNKKQLIMVEANGNKLLLATSENGVQLLSGSDNKIEEEETLEYQPRKESFKNDLDQEIDQLEKSFFQKKNKKNPYQQEEPEVVTHFSKKLKNIKKL